MPSPGRPNTASTPHSSSIDTTWSETVSGMKQIQVLSALATPYAVSGSDLTLGLDPHRCGVRSALYMDRENLSRVALTVALTSVAGYVDAAGFLRLGHLFVSFMSGNSTHFAVATQSHAWDQAESAGGIVALFVIGVIAGRLLATWARSWGRPVVLGIESLLLALAAAIGTTTVSMVVPIVVAMGVQNAAIHKESAASMGLTYVTGTLVSLGDKLADALRPSSRQHRWAWLPHLAHWCALVLGAIGGALAYRTWGAHALLIPAGCTAALSLAIAGSQVRSS